MRHHLDGEMASRRVWLDGVELKPGPSQRVHNHSPDGFNWGYGGSGPAQLALAVCLALTRDRGVSVLLHQEFKRAIVALLPQDDFDVWIEWDLTRKPAWAFVPRAALWIGPESTSPAIEAKPENPERSEIKTVRPPWCGLRGRCRQLDCTGCLL